MNVTELRIGNLVYDPYDEVTNVDLAILGYISKCQDERQKVYSYRPIPLTEEWFNKRGKKDENGDYYIQHPTNENLRFYLTNGFIQKTKGCCCVISNYIHVTKIHIFQNLYFALTGEELT